MRSSLLICWHFEERNGALIRYFGGDSYYLLLFACSLFSFGSLAIYQSCYICIFCLFLLCCVCVVIYLPQKAPLLGAVLAFLLKPQIIMRLPYDTSLCAVKSMFMFIVSIASQLYFLDGDWETPVGCSIICSFVVVVCDIEREDRVFMYDEYSYTCHYHRKPSLSGCCC